MCDTLVALPGATASSRMLFGKNSDRERNESQFLEMVPRQQHKAGSPLNATYITIPQVAETHAVLLSRPFWLWGAEMGANEHGVVIGNEAMHATVKAQRKRALLGMDLVRLGLERATTAAEAVAVITELLERHGQGGNCGHLHRFYYHNGFIIADAKEAFVLETVGRWWAVERVKKFRALSNAFSIGASFDRISDAVRDHAQSQGWMGADARFDFAERFLDAARDAVSFGRGRCARGMQLLERGKGKLDALGMMAILRDHGAEAERDPHWHPADTVGRTICMHAAEGPRAGQTTGSMVTDFTDAGVIHWMTGTSSPCTSVFKPVLMQAGLPKMGPRPTDAYDDRTLWWRHERLHRGMLGNFGLLKEFAAERDTLEQGFVARMRSALEEHGATGERTHAVLHQCWAEALSVEATWLARTAHNAGGKSTAFGRSWTRLNRKAGFAPTPPHSVLRRGAYGALDTAAGSLVGVLHGWACFRQKGIKMSFRAMTFRSFAVACLGWTALGGVASAQTIEWRAGALGGGWYTIVSGASKMLEDKNAGMTVKAIPGAGAANPTAVQNGQAQLAMSIDIFAKMAREGTGVYEGKPKHEKLAMVGQSLGDTPYHFIRAKGQTLGMEELFKDGRNIRFGGAKAGATDEITLRWVMANYGQTYESLRARGWRFVLADYAEVASAFKDAQIDYVFFAQGLPGASIVDMSTGREGELLAMPESLLSAIKDKYGMGAGTIPAATYPRYQQGDVKVLNMKTTLLTSLETPEDVVYKVTKTLCENEAELPKIHSSLKDYKCATAVSERPVPVHPGALRYYRERGLAAN